MLIYFCFPFLCVVVAGVVQRLVTNDRFDHDSIYFRLSSIPVSERDFWRAYLFVSRTKLIICTIAHATQRPVVLLPFQNLRFLIDTQAHQR